MIYIPDSYLDQLLLEDLQYGDLTTRALGIGQEEGEITFFHRQGMCQRNAGGGTFTAAVGIKSDVWRSGRRSRAARRSGACRNGKSCRATSRVEGHAERAGMVLRRQRVSVSNEGHLYPRGSIWADCLYA